MDADRLHALLGAGRSLVSELDPDAILRRLLDVARELTGAQYAAIGVLDDQREELERFVTAGIDAAAHKLIGDLPRGRGVLGVLIDEPQPLRLHDVGGHPLSYGFPPGHPPMRTFLGVPILIGGESWGNLYLAEKPEDFTADDEESAMVLADWAAVAIANARSYQGEARRRADLERVNRTLETTTEIARSLSGITDLDRILELIVKRSRALVDARVAHIVMAEGDDEVVVAAIAGEGVGGLRGTRMPLEESLAAPIFRLGRARRFEELPRNVFARRRLGAHRAIAAPMLHRGRPVGVLILCDPLSGERMFSEDDQRLVEAFAASAATAMVAAQTAADTARRRGLAASEAERTRWARELHDETLQELGGLRVLLSSALRSDDPERWQAAIGEAITWLGSGIENLRALITDLRPAALDQLGLEAALEALVARAGAQSGLKISLASDLDFERGRSPARLPAEIEVAAYRLVQEALTNVIKHADAERVTIELVQSDELTVVVTDDGRGFDAGQRGSGFGLVGMQERVEALTGAVEVVSAAARGTTVRARIPLATNLPQAAAL